PLAGIMIHVDLADLLAPGQEVFSLRLDEKVVARLPPGMPEHWSAVVEVEGAIGLIERPTGDLGPEKRQALSGRDFLPEAQAEGLAFPPERFTARLENRAVDGKPRGDRERQRHAARHGAALPRHEGDR